MGAALHRHAHIQAGASASAAGRAEGFFNGGSKQGAAPARGRARRGCEPRPPRPSPPPPVNPSPPPAPALLETPSVKMGELVAMVVAEPDTMMVATHLVQSQVVGRCARARPQAPRPPPPARRGPRGAARLMARGAGRAASAVADFLSVTLPLGVRSPRPPAPCLLPSPAANFPPRRQFTALLAAHLTDHHLGALRKKSSEVGREWGGCRLRCSGERESGSSS
jgi:hypothetical protein